MNTPSPLESLFFAALEKGSPAERAAFLEEACANDSDLRDRVERMLAAQIAAGSFLEVPVQEMNPTIGLPVTEKAGDTIGPYKLLQQIGEGGMGVVYMAEQTEPVERRVALKIIKPGMDTRQVIARFEAERQALAMMDHPNIAKVLDAGTTDTGRPYFVMELVKGVPITKYCDEHQLTPRERLALFIPVCQAIQHAHQKGVIHRDIKPSNVLVAEYDDRSIAKVIDFGVAKATDHRLTDKTMFTEFGQVLGTLEYMSPEQAKLNQWDIDTRSDIYSLGVLLYELLSGETPFDQARLRNAAFDEILRVIREEEPMRPSVRLSGSESAPSIAACRRIEPRQLSTLLRGELDWIVMKSLEKDRTRRYETANKLAEDIKHYLGNETVEACPPSVGYRLRKFAVRHKSVITSLAAIFTVMLVGASVAAWQAVRATHERNRAEAAEVSAFQEARRAAEQAESAMSERDKANAVVSLIQDMLSVTDADRVRRRDYTVVQLLDEFTISLNRQSQQLNDQPEVESRLRQIIGKAYREYLHARKAKPQFERSLELIAEVHGEQSLQYADCLRELGITAYERWWSDGVEEEMWFQRALSKYRELGEHARELETLSWIINNLLGQSRIEEAEQLGERALSTADSLGLGDSVQVTLVIANLARVKSALGKHAAAVRLTSEANSRLDRLHANTPIDYGWHWLSSGRVFRDAGRLDDAEECFRKSIVCFREAHTPEPQENEVRATVLLAELLEEQGDPETARQVLDGFEPKALAVALTGAAHTELQRQRNPQLATEKLSRAVLLEPDGSDADFLAWWSATDPYSPYCESGEGIALAQIATATEPHVPKYWTTLGVALYHAGQIDEAVDALNKSVALAGKPDVAGGLFLAMCHWELGHKQEARDFYDLATQEASESMFDDAQLRRFRTKAAEMLGIRDEGPPAAVLDE